LFALCLLGSLCRKWAKREPNVLEKHREIDDFDASGGKSGATSDLQEMELLSYWRALTQEARVTLLAVSRSLAGEKQQ
jgi:hypothetical protein